MNRRKDGNIARERAIVATRGTILDDVERAAGDHIVVFEGIVCTDINVTVTDRTIVFKSAHCYIEGGPPGMFPLFCNRLLCAAVIAQLEIVPVFTMSLLFVVNEPPETVPRFVNS